MRKFLNITKALSDENRVRALLALRTGELCVCQIIELLGLAPSTVSKHMAILVQADLVEFRKEGRWHYYRLPGSGDSHETKDFVNLVISQLENSSIAKDDLKRVKGILRKDIIQVCECYKN